MCFENLHLCIACCNFAIFNTRWNFALSTRVEFCSFSTRVEILQFSTRVEFSSFQRALNSSFQRALIFILSLFFVCVDYLRRVVFYLNTFLNVCWLFEACCFLLEYFFQRVLIITATFLFESVEYLVRQIGRTSAPYLWAQLSSIIWPSQYPSFLHLLCGA